MFSINKLISVAIALIFSLVSFSTYAGEFDLRLSNRSVQTHVSLEGPGAKTLFGAGYLYHDPARHLVDLGFHAQGQTSLANLPTTVAIGVQGNFFKDRDLTGNALAIGGSVRVNIPDVPGLSAEAALHYAPQILSFSDARDFKRFRTQADYRIIKNADVFAGYQYISTSTKSRSNYTLESSMFLGMKILF